MDYAAEETHMIHMNFKVDEEYTRAKNRMGRMSEADITRPARKIARYAIHTIWERVLTQQMDVNDRPLAAWSAGYAEWRKTHPGKYPGKILAYTGKMLESVRWYWRKRTRTHAKIRIRPAGARAMKLLDIHHMGKTGKVREWFGLSPRDRRTIRKFGDKVIADEFEKRK